MYERLSEDLTKPERSISERHHCSKKDYSSGAILHSSRPLWLLAILRYSCCMPAKGWHTRRFSALRAIFMTGVGDAIPEASYPFGTILRRIACVSYITLNRLHYLRGLQNTAEAPCVCDMVSARKSFSAFASYTTLFAFSHFKEDHIDASTAVRTFT